MATRSMLDQDMILIRDDILRMGSLVIQALSRAYDAMKTQDGELAQTIVNDDDIIDHLHEKIEDQVTKTFALQQPMARDLRKLIADLLISNELERMGDHAEGIARSVALYPGDTLTELPAEISRMKDQVTHMLNQVMDAYVDMDPDKARKLALLDDEVDDEYHKLFRMLIEAMSAGSISVDEGTHLLWAGHSLERIGDRVTNISERIVYAQSGAVKDFNPKPDERE